MDQEVTDMSQRNDNTRLAAPAPEQTAAHPDDAIRHLGSAVVIPEGTGTVEGVTRFATPSGEYVRRATTASEFEQVDLFEVLEDGTEVWVGGYAVDLAELRANRVAARRASFRVIEGGLGAHADTILPPPPSAPAIDVVPFGADDDRRAA